MTVLKAAAAVWTRLRTKALQGRHLRPICGARGKEEKVEGRKGGREDKLCERESVRSAKWAPRERGEAERSEHAERGEAHAHVYVHG